MIVMFCGGDGVGFNLHINPGYIMLLACEVRVGNVQLNFELCATERRVALGRGRRAAVFRTPSSVSHSICCRVGVFPLASYSLASLVRSSRVFVKLGV